MAASLDLRSKRVCVTGGAGFLGGFVVEALRARGVETIVVPRKSEYDLTTSEAIARLLADARPDVIIHLAAVVGGIGANKAHPGSFFYQNAMMGIELIERARLAGTEKLVLAGTICAYPKFAPIPFREETLWDGYPEETNAPYGLAKKMMLVQAQAYREEYGTNAIFLLPVNLYGPRDNFDLESSHVIPALIRKMIEARDAGAAEVVCWGDGSPTREFLYVGDAAEAIVLATERYDGAEPVNLGSGEEISIERLSTTIADVVGFTGTLVWDTSRPNGQPRRKLATDRAEREFGFVARTSFEEGLKQTVAWYESQTSRVEPTAR